MPGQRAIAGNARSLGGAWVSGGCGARGYRRVIMFEADTFEVHDIPRPCPGECVVQWVVRRLGRFTVRASEIALSISSTDDPDHEIADTQPVPRLLVIDAGAIAEKLPDGSVCRYARY
jgi:hypothetical protein